MNIGQPTKVDANVPKPQKSPFSSFACPRESGGETMT